MRPLLILLLLLSLTACAMGPDYKRPGINIPQAWQYRSQKMRLIWPTQHGGNNLTTRCLNELISRCSLKENYDLKIAAARVEEYVGRILGRPFSSFSAVLCNGTGQAVSAHRTA